MIVSTKGIVLRTTKYGESSVIVSVFTRECGLKSYIQNGIRKGRSQGKANYFSIGSILLLEVYNRENKSLERIKELTFSYVFTDITTDIVKSSILYFVVELLNICCEENHIDTNLFDFVETYLLDLDKTEAVAADLPIHFMLELSHYLGFKPIGIQSIEEKFFSLEEGFFTAEEGVNTLNHEMSVYINHYVLRSNDSLKFQITKVKREEILDALERYYEFHLQGYRRLKCREVLKQIFL